MPRALDPRFGPGDDRDRAALDRFGDEVLAIEARADEGAEDVARRDLAMVEREARHFDIPNRVGIAPDAGKVAQNHAPYSPFSCT